MTPDTATPRAIEAAWLPLFEARTAQVAAETKLANARKEADRISAQSRKILAEAEKAKTAIGRAGEEAVLNDREPPPISPEHAEAIRRAKTVGPASADALKVKAAEVATAETEVAAAKASFRGAVWVYAGAVQDEALADLKALWPAVAECLARLLAADEVRGRIADRDLKIHGLSTEPPWSGAAVVSKFIANLPARFASADLTQQRIQALSKPHIEELVSKIEKGN